MRSEVHGRKLMRYYIRQFLNLFKDGKNILTNNFVIANKFYLFSQHSSKIKAPKNQTFTDYLSRHNTNNFNFHETNEECVMQIITDLAPKTCFGFDGMGCH